MMRNFFRKRITVVLMAAAALLIAAAGSAVYAKYTSSFKKDSEVYVRLVLNENCNVEEEIINKGAYDTSLFVVKNEPMPVLKTEETESGEITVVPQRENYIFCGYYSKEFSDIEVPTEDEEQNLKYYDADGSAVKDKWDASCNVLYARWIVSEFSITYVFPESGKEGKPSVYSEEDIYPDFYTLEDLPLTIPAGESLTTGYVFDKWYLCYDENAASGVNKYTDPLPLTDGDDPVQYLPVSSFGDITLYGRLAPRKYVIRFNKNNDEVSGEMENIVKEEDEIDTSFSLPFNEYEWDYKFSGWSALSDDNGTCAFYDDEESVTVTKLIDDGVHTETSEDGLTIYIDLYTAWAIPHVLNFENMNTGTEVPEHITTLYVGERLRGLYSDTELTEEASVPQAKYKADDADSVSLWCVSNTGSEVVINADGAVPDILGYTDAAGRFVLKEEGNVYCVWYTVYFRKNTANLPDGYTELEYIESPKVSEAGTNDGAYINTGVGSVDKKDNYLRISFSLNPTYLKNKENYFYNAGSTINATPWLSFEYNAETAGKSGAYWNTGSKSSGDTSYCTYLLVHPMSVGNRYSYDVRYKNDLMAVKGSYNGYAEYSGKLGNGTAPVIYFFSGSSSTERRPSAEKMYYINIYEGKSKNEIPLRKYVPASDGTDLGMYDLITKSLYKNKGNMAFTTHGEYSQIFAFGQEGRLDLHSAEYTRNGYVFDGWTLERDTDADKDYSDGDMNNQGGKEIWKSITGTAGNMHVDLYTSWVPEEYRITYQNASETDISMLPESYTYEECPVSLPASGKDGYYINWYYDSALKDRVDDNVISMDTTGDLNLYAKFEKTKITVEFDKNEPEEGSISGSTPSLELYGGDTDKGLPAIGYTTDFKYGFMGWSVEKDKTPLYQNKQSISADELLTHKTAVYSEDRTEATVKLYANWIPIHEVNFRNMTSSDGTVISKLYAGQDHTGLYNDMDLTAEPASVPGASSVDASGTDVFTWCSQKDGGTVVIKNGEILKNIEGFTDASGKWLINNNIELYCVWLKVNYIKHSVSLPEGYKELEYIESDGQDDTINTGIIPRDYGGSLFRIQISFNPVNVKTMGNYFYQAQGSGSDWFSFEYYEGDNKGGYWNTGNNTFIGPHGNKSFANIRRSYDIEYNKGTMKIYGNPALETSATYTGNLGGTGSPLYILSGSKESYSSNRLYACVISGGSPEEELRHLIPVKNAEGVNGLYDTVSGQFFGNVGNGAFGGDVRYQYSVYGENINLINEADMYTFTGGEHNTQAVNYSGWAVSEGGSVRFTNGQSGVQDELTELKTGSTGNWEVNLYAVNPYELLTTAVFHNAGRDTVYSYMPALNEYDVEILNDEDGEERNED